LLGWLEKPPEVGHPFTLVEWTNGSATATQGNAAGGVFTPFEVKSTSFASFEPKSYTLPFVGAFDLQEKTRIKEINFPGKRVQQALAFIGFRGLYPSVYKVGPNHALDGFVFV
jgi:hypothetical protein